MMVYEQVQVHLQIYVLCNKLEMHIFKYDNNRFYCCALFMIVKDTLHDHIVKGRNNIIK